MLDVRGYQPRGLVARMLWAVCALGIVTAGAAACDSTVTVPDDELVRIEVTASADLQPMAPALRIEYSIANNGNRPLYLDPCSPLVMLEKSIIGEWRDVYRPGCLLNMPPPYELGPGKVFSHAFRIPWGDWGYPNLRVDELPGAYRAEFMVSRTLQPRPDGSGPPVLGGPLPVEFRRGEFEVRSP